MSDLVSSLDIGNLPRLPGIYSVFTAQGQPGGLPVPTADYVGMYARVNDLFGYGVVDLMLCQSYVISGSVSYKWRPVRDQWPNTGVISVDQNITLTPLQSPTIIRLSGTITLASKTITPSTLNAYPGLSYDIRYDGPLTVLGLSLAGSVTGTLPFVSGVSKIFYFDGSTFITK